MKLIVADTGPLNYLIQIEQADILGHLVDEVWLTASIRKELSDPRAPLEVRGWISQPPAWVRIVEDPPLQNTEGDSLSCADWSVIHLAKQADAILLMDEQEGRYRARCMGVQTIGTLGILRSAAEAGILDLEDAVRRLQLTSIRISASIIADVLQNRKPPTDS
jgi:predicted nucleic acid-binding protein